MSYSLVESCSASIRVTLRVLFLGGRRKHYLKRELSIVNSFTNRRNSISKKPVLRNYLYLAFVIRKQILLCFTK
jgi:hypothetical protein